MNDLALPPREGKPRQRGITAMIDFGPDEMGWAGSPGGIRNVLAAAADYIDHAKIYALNALLLPEDAVRDSARLYRDHDCHPFAGGMLFEYAYGRGELDGLESLLNRVALPALEVSENYVTLESSERRQLIERFRNTGFDVVYEFGRKAPTTPMDVDRLEEVVHEVAECGIDHVIIEQSEIDMLPAPAFEDLARRNWWDRLVIEADPYRFPEQHVDLIGRFGPEVSLCNIAPGQVLRLEGFRRGIGRAVGYSIMDGLV